MCCVLLIMITLESTTLVLYVPCNAGCFIVGLHTSSYTKFYVLRSISCVVHKYVFSLIVGLPLIKGNTFISTFSNGGNGSYN